MIIIPKKHKLIVLNTLVPLEFYTKFYYYLLMAIVFIVYFKSKTSNIDDKSNLIFINFFGLINLSLIILHIGLRPISSFYFTDMGTYAQSFRAYASGSQVDKIGDIYFNYFIITIYFIVFHNL